MLLLLVFCSGFAGLIYQVLWMKQLGLLFGNTAHAAGATLAAFFAGLAVGSWFWGRRAAIMKNPLRILAWLHIGIAVTALSYFAIVHGYRWGYPLFYRRIGSVGWLLAVKFALALALVFPPAFFMGGTIPVVGQSLIRNPASFGRTAALLYGINTLGAALGAAAAGFYLPLWLGFNLSCLSAMVITGMVAAGAFFLSRSKHAAAPDKVRLRGKARLAARVRAGEAEAGRLAEPAIVSGPGAGPHRLAFASVCFLSGFGVLALEVLWTRMFAQVLENSVYTFATILVTVLICLAAGALTSALLARLSLPPVRILAGLLLLGGIAITATPFIFIQATGQLSPVSVHGSWHKYIGVVFGKCFLTVGPPAWLLGIVFPYLMKAEESRAVVAGRSLGRLAAVNTAGAILGSLACGFVFLDLFGMWRTMQMIALLYLFASALLPLSWKGYGLVARGVAGGVVLLHLGPLNPGKLPVIGMGREGVEEEILETWEGSDCTVAAIRDRHGISLKVDSHYGLGSTGATVPQVMQADIPLKIHPNPESVFFLGMGTGITAGAALLPEYGVKRVVACELVPEVVAAARKYIADDNGHDHTNGLFTDRRASILVEDGRHYLMATRDSYDLIISDLFVPYRSGAGSLYTKEHFQNARERLLPGGLFVQWLPLYQLTENEFSIIARTMLEAFGYVSLWRNNFQPGDEVVALIGHRDGNPLPASPTDSSAAKIQAVQGKSHYDLLNLALPFDRQTVTFFYCGNLTGTGDRLFSGTLINTDDRPRIEYLAPRTFRVEKARGIPWFIGPPLAEFIGRVQAMTPPGGDPLLVNRTPANRRLPLAGSAFHKARIWQIIGDDEQCAYAWLDFLREWLDRDG